jgi:hypothetical protein
MQWANIDGFLRRLGDGLPGAQVTDVLGADSAG